MSFNPQTGYSSSNFALKDGSNITTSFTVNGNRITNVKNPQQITDAVNKSYVDTSVGNNWKTSGNSGLSSNGRIGTTDVNDTFRIIQGGYDIITIREQGFIDVFNGALINYGVPDKNSILAIKQNTQLDDNQVIGQLSSIYFENSSDTNAYYIGYGVGDVFAVYRKDTSNNRFQMFNIGVNSSILNTGLSLPSTNRSIKSGNSFTSGLLAIKQSNQLSTASDGSDSSISFENDSSSDAYYIGYAQGGTFGIYRKDGSNNRFQMFNIGNTISTLNTELHLTGSSRSIEVGDPLTNSAIIIKQTGQLNQNAGSSVQGLAFENPGSSDSYYIGYAVGGSFSIFNHTSTGVYTRIADFKGDNGGVRFYNQLDMGLNKIISMAEPAGGSDATTKNYVDNTVLSAKTNVWETNFDSNNPGTGDVITTILTPPTTSNAGFNAFNVNSTSWQITDFVSPSIIYIQFSRTRTLNPGAKFVISGIVGPSNFNNWEILISIDGVTIVTILSSTVTLSQTQTVLTYTGAIATYNYIGFRGLGVNTGTTPGIGYMQLYDKWS